MLAELRVRDLAIIESVDVAFQPGFNAISGETGAGKSILLHALGLALGARASADAVRTGADAARVEATFQVGDDAMAWLRERDLPAEDGETVVVRRIVGSGGRSRAFVNDSPTSVTALRSLGAFLVDFASQHEAAVLLDESRHREILDRFSGCEDLANRVTERVRQLRQTERERADAEAAASRRSDRLDLLRYQLQELRAAGIREGELEELEVEARRLDQAEQVLAAVTMAEQALYSGERAAVESVGSSLAALRAFTELDAELAGAVEQLQGALYELEDAARVLAGLGGRLQADPERQQEVEDRVQELRSLLRKHRTDEAGLLGRVRELEQEIEQAEQADERAASLSQRLDRQLSDAQDSATELSESRRGGARQLGERIAGALQDLAMDGARFTAVVREDPAGLTEMGLDQVQFMFSANSGEEERPIARIASGGELSRVLLAVKEILGSASAVGTFVLDEVDAGIGGATADVVGRKLKALSVGRQLIAITHLPAIAAMADAHYRVGKREVDGRTEAWVERLGDDERVEEVARMMAGERHAERSRALAGEMLDEGSPLASDDLVVNYRPPVETPGQSRG